jgi:hypothetical protein
MNPEAKRAVHRWTSAVWSSLRQGRDLDLYLMVVLASVLFVLSAFGIATANVIAAATLAVLTLLGVALLVGRHQTEQLKVVLSSVGRKSKANTFFSGSDNLEEVKTLVQSSHEVWMWGTTLARHLPFLAPVIRDEMKRGLRVRVMLVSPGSPAFAVAAHRTVESSREGMASELESNLRRLRRIASGADPLGNLEVRLTEYLAPYSMYVFNPKSESGMMELGIAFYRSSQTSTRPIFRLDAATDSEWYRYFLSQFEAVWGDAKPAVPHIARD